MPRLREWLHPPRNLLFFFVLVVCLPAATLIALGFRLLDQDRALASQRQIELLDHAADEGVRVLAQALAAQMKRLTSSACDEAGIPEDAVCITFQADRIEVVPPDRIPYFPRSRRLKEAPSQPFEGVEAYEFREPLNLNMALAVTRYLTGSSDPAIRAGALLRQARILHKQGRAAEALASFADMRQLEAVSISGEPADLVARRARCSILQEQAKTDALRREASELARDLRTGKWQLDRETFFHVEGQIKAWLASDDEADDTPAGEALGAGLEWVYEKRAEPPSSGVHLVTSNNVPVTVIWSFGDGRHVAFIAGPKFVEAHWATQLQKTVSPAQAYLNGIGATPLPDRAHVQRTAADTGLPWTLILTNAEGLQEPQEFRERRRNLTAGLAVLVVLIAAGSYFAWRAIHRELAVARLQSDFVSAVSHEFRTPLTALRQFNDLLSEEDGPTAEKRRRFYQAQTRATERLYRLVESLLDFGRMEAGRRPYSFKPVDAAVLAHDVVEEFVRETSGLGFDLQCSAADSEAHPISADPEALSRALWNLLDNAVKYSGSSRNVEVSVSRSNGTVAIAVRDQGTGIPLREQKTIFQKFVRGTSSTSGGIRGTGLGLAMVRHIVQAHRGSVQLQSTEGKGSTFTIVLPVRGE